VKLALKIGDGAACIFISRLAFGMAAEGLKLLSDFRTGPARVVDPDLAVENHFLKNLLFARRQE